MQKRWFPLVFYFTTSSILLIFFIIRLNWIFFLLTVGGFDGEQNLSTVECFQRCESSPLYQNQQHQQVRLPDDVDGVEDGRVSLVVVNDETNDGVLDQLEVNNRSSDPNISTGPLDLFSIQFNRSNHFSQRQRRQCERSRSFRDRPSRQCKSRDDEDLEEWLEEGPRSLLAPRMGMSYQVDAVPSNATVLATPSLSTDTASRSDAGSMDLPTVTTEVRLSGWY